MASKAFHDETLGLPMGCRSPKSDGFSLESAHAEATTRGLDVFSGAQCMKAKRFELEESTSVGTRTKVLSQRMRE